ncbi:hypothetical protein Lal_00047171 [Lupinus albus]|nr:hypothetical protein Lal_00047171 [Lupinus albus]
MKGEEIIRHKSLRASQINIYKDVLRSDKIKVEDSISAIVLRQRCSKIIIALSWNTSLLNHNLPFTFINLKDHIAINLL